MYYILNKLKLINIKNMKEKKLKVSDLFVDIYINLNVCSQVERMKQLSKKELYLLIILAIDKHSDEDPVLLHNLEPFESYADKIFDLSDDKEVEDTDLLELIKETDDKYINTSYIVDSKNPPLRDPLTKEEVRDANINLTIKND